MVADMFMIMIALFFTTPEVAASQLELLLKYLGQDNWEMPAVIKTFLPTFLLWTVAALMPSLITWSIR